jgi:anti-sigma28 factor (negative regulator of flagellin synthesis)
MANISSISNTNLGAAASVRPAPSRRPGDDAAATVQRAVDIVEISPEALRGAPAAERVDGIRRDLVARVRAEINAGTYESLDKIVVASDKLTRDLKTVM